MTRRISIVTSARSDFGLLRPLIDEFLGDPAFSLRILATGMHFSERHGHTIDEIVAGGYGPHVRSVLVTVDDDAASVAAAIGEGVSKFSAVLSEERPDILLVLGDRFDMLPAPLAALPLRIPVAHLAGGEITEGVIDDSVRHVVTKLSHLHFPTLRAYADRLVRMGEEPWRITVSGEPGLDALRTFRFRPREWLFDEIGLDPAKPLTVFTFHPETLSPDATAAAIVAILDAAVDVPTQILFTYPNSDTGSNAIIDAIERFAAAHPGHRCVKSLGRERYLNALRHADCMVGNSSSGIVEAASFELPVVDIGDRQTGRLAPANVLRAPAEMAAVGSAWRAALSPAFRASLKGLINPYGDGHACERIRGRLKAIELGQALITKKFCDQTVFDG